MKFSALRTIAKAINFFAWIVFISNVAVLLVATYGLYLSHLEYIKYNIEPRLLYSTFGIVVLVIVGVLISLFILVIMLGVSELIKLFINLSDKLENIDNNIYVLAANHEEAEQVV
ncbi:MAG: hypothetical protein R2800_03975 [Flavipsychrobacter sp.]